MKEETTKPTTTIWVTEEFFGIDCVRVEQYEAVDVRGSSATVLVRGCKKVIRKAQCRKVWTDEFSMREYAVRVMRGALERHQRAAVDLEARLARRDVDVRVVPHVDRPLTKIIVD